MPVEATAPTGAKVDPATAEAAVKSKENIQEFKISSFRTNWHWTTYTWPGGREHEGGITKIAKFVASIFTTPVLFIFDLLSKSISWLTPSNISETPKTKDASGTPEGTSEDTPETASDETASATPDGTPEATPETASDETASATPDGTPEDTPETASGTPSSDETAASATPDGTPEDTPETATTSQIKDPKEGAQTTRIRRFVNYLISADRKVTNLACALLFAAAGYAAKRC